MMTLLDAMALEASSKRKRESEFLRDFSNIKIPVK
jgi:hypothetical protein